MSLLLGRGVSYSLVHIFRTCSQSLLSKPGLATSTRINLSLTARVPHRTLFVNSAGRSGGTMPERRPFVRLPTDVYPVNYGLCLTPDLIYFTFEGRLEARVEVRESGRNLSVHRGDLM